MMKCCMGMQALVHVTMFLVISFFVLLSAQKTDSKNLKLFGFAIAVLLWISAIMVFCGVSKCCCPMMKMKSMHMMDSKKACDMTQQMNKQVPAK